MLKMGQLFELINATATNHLRFNSMKYKKLNYSWLSAILLQEWLFWAEIKLFYYK